MKRPIALGAALPKADPILPGWTLEDNFPSAMKAVHGLTFTQSSSKSPLVSFDPSIAPAPASSIALVRRLIA